MCRRLPMSSWPDDPPPPSPLPPPPTLVEARRGHLTLMQGDKRRHPPDNVFEELGPGFSPEELVATEFSMVTK